MSSPAAAGSTPQLLPMASCPLPGPKADALNDDARAEVFLRLKDVMRLTTLSRSALYRLISRSEFPSQVKLSENSVAWVSSEVLGWMTERAERRSPKASGERQNDHVSSERSKL